MAWHPECPTRAGVTQTHEGRSGWWSTQAIPSYPSDQRPLAGLWPPSSPASILTLKQISSVDWVTPNLPALVQPLVRNRSAAVLKRVAGLDGGGAIAAKRRCALG